ncbi:MAG TPA: 2-amino-4-hydroxy-6-hydroxymethyldihydropteridine diphosphokinase [Pelagibacterales bacterium]|nr:2-amino-4-hydroxy-6-hydroxymethyldihydropteridine diphosphokinase [Pelagibacterales bacterium]
MSLNKVYIALGANVGNWKNNFNQAVRLILKIGVITKLAPVYLSHPYGYERQHYFYNSALELETNLSPYDLFKELQMIEKKLQKNKLFVNGPRKIDLDIIFFNKLILTSSKLTIPHYEAHLRDFVLLPLMEMNPFYMHPLKRKTVSGIYKKLKDKYVFKIKRRRKESLIVY